jgi:hypothetical protein
MKRYLNGAIVALGMAGASLTTSAPASAQNVDVGVHVGGVGFGDVAYGYRDGYWDHGHRWHRWHRGEMASYRNGAGNQYNDWDHNRDRDLGWRESVGPAVIFNVDNVAFGYQDGYWDHGHRWHEWREGEMASYRNAPGNRYNEWNHDRDRDNGWHR